MAIRLALLIDADNVTAKHLPLLLEAVAKLGSSCVRRVYGDWTKPNMNGWREGLLQHSIQPIQQFAYTTGKNATDGAMIIDAMDLLYSGRFDGFCLVSSDSDFTRLAVRIREQGLKVFGFGERRTPQPFVISCDRFVFLDAEETPTAIAPVVQPKSPVPAPKKAGDKKVHALIKAALNSAPTSAGWANLSAVGVQLRKHAPDFDSKQYGFSQLGDLIEATGKFEVSRPSANQGVVRVRVKSGQGPRAK